MIVVHHMDWRTASIRQPRASVQACIHPSLTNAGYDFGPALCTISSISDAWLVSPGPFVAVPRLLLLHYPLLACTMLPSTAPPSSCPLRASYASRLYSAESGHLSTPDSPGSAGSQLSAISSTVRMAGRDSRRRSSSRVSSGEYDADRSVRQHSAYYRHCQSSCRPTDPTVVLCDAARALC